MNSNKLQDAITNLAALHEGWSLLADTLPVEFISEVTAYISNLENKCANLEQQLATTKEERVYYQDIVYHVSDALDLLDDKLPGQGIVCGTAKNPSNDVEARITAFCRQLADITKERDKLKQQLIDVQDEVDDLTESSEY